MNIKASVFTELFWNEYQLNPQRNDYNIVIDQEINGNLDVLKLKQVLKDFVLEHLLFNSHLELIVDELYWVKNNYISELQVKRKSDEEIKELCEAPFSLESGPLYRFWLFKKNNNKYDFIAVFHHALVDGASSKSCFKRISDQYNNTANYIDLHAQKATILRNYQKN